MLEVIMANRNNLEEDKTPREASRDSEKCVDLTSLTARLEMVQIQRTLDQHTRARPAPRSNAVCTDFTRTLNAPSPQDPVQGPHRAAEGAPAPDGRGPSSWANEMSSWASRGHRAPLSPAPGQFHLPATSAKHGSGRRSTTEFEVSRTGPPVVRGTPPAKPRKARTKGWSADLSIFQACPEEVTASASQSSQGFRSASMGRARRGLTRGSPVAPETGGRATPKSQSGSKRFDRSSSFQGGFGVTALVIRDQRGEGSDGCSGRWGAAESMPTTPRKRSRNLSFDFDHVTAEYYGVKDNNRRPPTSPSPFTEPRPIAVAGETESRAAAAEMRLPPCSAPSFSPRFATPPPHAGAAARHKGAQEQTVGPPRPPLSVSPHGKGSHVGIQPLLAHISLTGVVRGERGVLLIDCDTDGLETSDPSDAEGFLYGRDN